MLGFTSGPRLSPLFCACGFLEGECYLLTEALSMEDGDDCSPRFLVEVIEVIVIGESGGFND